MTGGQMAPTTLDGEKTTTTPFGRDSALTGHPLHVCEVFNQLKAPVYIARVSVADTRRIMQAKAAIRKVFQIQKERRGYALLEVLAPCPTNLRMDADAAANFCMNEMEKEFPLGVFRDDSDRPAPEAAAVPQAADCGALFAGDDDAGSPVDDEGCAERRFKFAGYGGQGVLSLGLCVAEAARLERRHTLWFPSYGPEQRGGSANCSVVVSGRSIGSPTVEHPDVLVCMNLPAYERFVNDVAPGGAVVVDESVPIESEPPPGVRLIRWPAIRMAEELGLAKAANTMMLAALVKFDLTGLSAANLEAALVASFAKKPALGEKNRELLRRAQACEA
jgi:2-oxoisovalerate ferredoxin oxidoreductase beta subunit